MKLAWYRTALDYWTRLGTRRGDSPEALRAAAFANVLAGLVTVGGLVMAVTLFTVHDGLALATLALSQAYLVPFLLLHRAAKNPARLYIILFHNLASVAFTHMIGPGAGSQLITFFTVGTPIMLFDRRARGYMIVGVLSSLFAFFLPVWFPRVLGGILPQIPVDPAQTLMLRTTMAFLTFAVILVELFYLKTQFERAEQRLHRVVENTGQLLKIACHDMASPLAVLDTALEIRERELDGRAPDRVHLVLKRTSERIQSLLTVIRKLHAASDARVDLQPVLLTEAVNAAVASIGDALGAKRILLETEGLTEDLAVMGDWTIMTESILANVLSNAVKFSPRGGAVRVVAASNKHGIVLSVVDHGIGMAPEMVHGATRGEMLPSRPGTEGETGSGFGLTLVRTFMTKLGGRVTIESEVGAGARGGVGTTVRLFFRDARVGAG